MGNSNEAMAKLYFTSIYITYLNMIRFLSSSRNRGKLYFAHLYVFHIRKRTSEECIFYKILNQALPLVFLRKDEEFLQYTFIV